MDYDKFCTICKHKKFTLQSGILCGLTNEKPNFMDECEHFELNPDSKQLSKNTSINIPKKYIRDLPEINVILRKWGIGLIVLGVLHLIITQFLNPIWGVLIIILGILNLVIQKKEMFIANGLALLLVGIMNILSSVLPGVGNYFWIIFGVFQVYWGIREIIKYNLYKKEETEEQKKSINSDKNQDVNPENILKNKHSGFGLTSFIIFCFAFLIMIITFTITILNGPIEPADVNEQSMNAALIGFSWIFNGLITIVGIGFGITGLLQKDRKKAYATLGLIFNFLLFLIFFPMFFQV